MSHVPSPPTTQFQPADRKLTLLLVEDEPAVRRGMTLLAKRLGHDVTAAGSLAEAQRLIAERAFDGFLLDIHLDEANSGFDLYDELEARHRGLERRVVFTTGDSISTRTRERLERAARPVLRKPFDMNDLRMVLNRIGNA
jgi:two-component system NtrC family sensor kinase